MLDTYRMMTAPTEATFRDKGSKFLAYAYPVLDEAEVKTHLQTLKKQYFDATHHCYAYILGGRQEQSRAQDDGEPNHTAGTPILNQIKAAGLTNTLVVVVRYFGGTKLGVAGLINAYKTATSLALQEAQTIEKFIQSTFTLGFQYVHMNQIMRLVKDYEAEIVAQDFQENCQLTLKVRLGFAPALRKALTDLAYEGITFTESQENNPNTLYLF